MTVILYVLSKVEHTNNEIPTPIVFILGPYGPPYPASPCLKNTSVGMGVITVFVSPFYSEELCHSVPEA